MPSPQKDGYSPEDKGQNCSKYDTSAKIGLPTPFGMAMGNKIKARSISDLALFTNKRPYKFPYKVCISSVKKWNLHKTLYYFCSVGNTMTPLITLFQKDHFFFQWIIKLIRGSFYSWSQLPAQEHRVVQGRFALVHFQSPRQVLLQPQLISSLHALDASASIDPSD